MGEYAITQKAGQGIAMAVERRAWLAAHYTPKPNYLSQTADDNQADNEATFTVVLRFGLQELLWSGQQSIVLRQAPGMVRDCLAQFLPTARPNLAGWRVVLDTSLLYDKDGSKLGLGSSAAACLLLTTAFAQIASLGHNPGLPCNVRNAALAQQAVLAHRAFQGGKGSGYDIWTSFLGGFSQFVGGEQPSASVLVVADKYLQSFALLKGAAEVRSGSALSQYKLFAQDNGDQARAYQKRCAQRCKLFIDLVSRPEQEESILSVLESARLDGIWLGDCLGISARPQPAIPSDKAWFAKALGAGNESILVIDATTLCATHAQDQAREALAEQGLCEHELSYGQAPGKLLLFGEHVALQGYPAVGLAIERHCRVYKIQLEQVPQSASYVLAPAAMRQGLKHSQEQLLDALERGSQTVPFVFLLESDIPAGGGYGSSAALSLALCRAMGWGDNWAMANRIDSVFHGAASGIDSGLCLARDLTLMVPWPKDKDCSELPAWHPRFDARKLDHKLGLWLCSSSVERQSNTRDLVMAIKTRLKDKDANTVARIATLGEISQNAISLCYRQKGEELCKNLGQLCLQAQEQLEKLGLGSHAMDRLFDLARQAGASGYKLSGAGSGGAFFCLFYQQQDAVTIAKLWLETGTCSPPIVIEL